MGSSEWKAPCIVRAALLTVATLAVLLVPGIVDAGESSPPPTVRTSEAPEWSKYYQPSRCGPIALYCVCKYYGLNTTIDSLASLSNCFSGRGTNIAGLMRAAQAMQLKPNAWDSSIRHLKAQRGPAIVDYPRHHFSVFLGWNGARARILDPPSGVALVSISELQKRWGKHVITFARSRAKTRRGS